jgi:hypothetical protein
MTKRLLLAFLASLAFASGAAFADAEKPAFTDAEKGAPAASSATQLSDAELDQIVAGFYIDAIVSFPNATTQVFIRGVNGLAIVPGPVGANIHVSVGTRVFEKCFGARVGVC